MGTLRYKGYSGSVEYSPEDNCLFGKVLGLKGTLISYEGNSTDEIKNDFEHAIDDYLESCVIRGIEPAKPYSGRLILRMSSELHEDIAEKAASMGSTINDFVIRSIKNELKFAH